MISSVMMGQYREMRWLRSSLVAALTACTAGLAHAGGGGHKAPLWLFVLLAVAGTPALHAVSGRRWHFGHLVAVMGLTQVVLHAVMSMTMPAGHEHSAAAAAHEVAGSVTPTMVLLHVGSTVFLAGVLAYGERLLAWTLHRLLRVTRCTLTLLPRPRPMPSRHRRRLSSTMPRAPCGSRAPPFFVVLSH